MITTSTFVKPHGAEIYNITKQFALDNVQTIFSQKVTFVYFDIMKATLQLKRQ